MRELRLKDNTQLTDKCIEFISEIEKLELIHIENTSITIKGLIKLLSLKELKSIILDFELDYEVDKLLKVSEQYTKLEITVKGKGVISNGKLNWS